MISTTSVSLLYCHVLACAMLVHGKLGHDYHESTNYTQGDRPRHGFNKQQEQIVAPDSNDYSDICATKDPDASVLQQVEKELEIFKTSERYSAYEYLENTEIDTYFHIVSTAADSNDFVSDELVGKQMTVLNDGFKGYSTLYPFDCYGRKTLGLDTKFRFNLVEISRTVNDTWATNTKDAAVELEMKTALRKGDCSSLNIYITRNIDGPFGFALGFALFPHECHASCALDGVVVVSGSLPGGTGAPFNQGDTLTHEVGHWMGLYHTFMGGTTEKSQEWNPDCIDPPGDYVYDTKVQRDGTTGCPLDRNTCPETPGLDPVHNFMDYSDDCCMHEFSAGQVDRMHSLWKIYRAPLEPTPAPTLSLTSAPTIIANNAGQPLSPTDTATPASPTSSTDTATTTSSTDSSTLMSSPSSTDTTATAPSSGSIDDMKPPSSTSSTTPKSASSASSTDASNSSSSASSKATSKLSTMSTKESGSPKHSKESKETSSSKDSRKSTSSSTPKSASSASSTDASNSSSSSSSKATSTSSTMSTKESGSSKHSKQSKLKSSSKDSRKLRSINL